MSSSKALRKRGAPLAMLAVLLGGWVFVRAATWDSPLAYPAMAMAPVDQAAPRGGSADYDGLNPSPPVPAPQSYAHSAAYPQPYPPLPYRVYPQAVYPPGSGYAYYPVYLPPGAYPVDPRIVYYASAGTGYGNAPLPSQAEAYAGHVRAIAGPSQFRLAPDLASSRPQAGGRALSRALGLDWDLGTIGGVAAASDQGRNRYSASQEARPPFGAQPIGAQPSSTDRWLFDVYGFYRQGSSALSITQGRQPIYGASQLALNLQWRARPSSSHDPRIYARAYHALVTGGESEVAAGASALPFGKVPVRLFAELRTTRAPGISDEGLAAQTDLRPAAYGATQIPPQKFPLGLSLETYGAAGYVGGKTSTYFLDGQAALTRPLTRISKPGLGSAAVSVGAGVWGGAQQGAHRVDIGPTVRFDVDIGAVPARVSVDYREKVAGDAEPDSGVAATVSTRF